MDLQLSEIRGIIVVDMQKGFINAHNSYLPGRINRFLSEHNFEDIIFTKFVNPGKNHFFYNCLDYQAMGAESEEGEIVDQLKEFASKGNIDEKEGYMPKLVVNGYLAEYLHLEAPYAMLVCGTDTNACVTATALTLAYKEVCPVILADLCGSSSGQEYHEHGLSNLSKLFGAHNIINSAEIKTRKWHNYVASPTTFQ